MILYRIVTAQHLDTDTVYQLYRTSLLTVVPVIVTKPYTYVYTLFVISYRFMCLHKCMHIIPWFGNCSTENISLIKKFKVIVDI